MEVTSRNTIDKILIECLGVTSDRITEDSDLATDLKADPLDHLQIVMEIEEKFEIHINDAEAEKLVTVGDLYAVVTDV